ECARYGEIPKFQKPLFGTTPPSALSGLVVQTFPREGLINSPQMRDTIALCRGFIHAADVR
ncbi:hypothetical protein J7431_08770, partial [Xanthomonas phaseoli pv. dieffenbachiae]|nr:hypothetical protein [Xanthomonas phaseoli pv. dieffenbachiae]